ncbi:MAG: adenylate/guanylate cyclase domain-containing protein [Treponema sp.]
MEQKNEKSKASDSVSKVTKVSFPISFKLILIFAGLVLLVLGITTYMVSTLVRNDEKIKAEETNLTINERTAETVSTMFVSLQNGAAGLFNSLMLLSEDDRNLASDLMVKDYFSRNKSVVFMKEKYIGFQLNPELNIYKAQITQKVNDWFDANEEIVKKVENGSIEIVNFSFLINRPVVCVLFPSTLNNETSCATVAFYSEELASLMSTGSYNSTFLINKEGDLLIYSDYDMMISGANFKNIPAVKNMMESTLESSQSLFPDLNGKKWFYAYNKIAGGMYVVTSVAESDVYETINHTTKRIILFSLAILFLSIFIILFFSKTITSPIEELVDASHKIQKRNFEINLQPRTHDEVGVLTSSFIEMSKGLSEREHLMSTFSKFTNTEIATKAAKGQIKLGGETKLATIFFSDIRSFTAMSEKMAPFEVVEFLNEYMTRMVECVKKTNGTVDKFIGDAIMVEWGVPQTSGTPENDAWNAVKTALMMRYALLDFNKERSFLGKPAVRIGCGINTGSVVAGQIGSNERMEYTVIGDAVNFASRTESLNKPFATDILITEQTWRLVHEKILYEEMPSVTVKGKEKPVKMFAVINAVGLKGPKTIDELRALLGVATPDLQKVNTDEEEKKYKITSKAN